MPSLGITPGAQLTHKLASWAMKWCRGISVGVDEPNAADSLWFDQFNSDPAFRVDTVLRLKLTAAESPPEGRDVCLYIPVAVIVVAFEGATHYFKRAPFGGPIGYWVFTRPHDQHIAQLLKERGGIVTGKYGNFYTLTPP